MLVGALLYKESRITVLYVIESEEISEKHYFGLTPLSSIYSAPLFAVCFQPQEPEQGSLSQPGLFPTDNTGSPGSANICTLDSEWEMNPAHAVAAEVWIWKGSWRSLIPELVYLVQVLHNHFR